MSREVLMLVDALAREKNVEREVVFEALEMALASASKKRYEEDVDIRVAIDRNSGEYETFRRWLVVPDEAGLQEPDKEILHFEAKEQIEDIEIGDYIEEQVESVAFGRIGAQTAKQVILQGIRDVERDNVYSEFNGRKDEMLVGVVQRNANGNIIIDLGKAEAILPREQQVSTDNYRVGSRIKVILQKIGRDERDRGPRIVVSRTDVKLVEKIFEMEVPEIASGTVEIKNIAREPGIRTKCAVAATQEGIDPVGACVGVRGTRIQNIVNELNGEKIDVVQWSPDIKEFIAHALSPAQVVEVQTLEGDKAVVIVPDKQLSLAIGKEGQNVRLAAKLTKWKIDIKSSSTLLDEMREASDARHAADTESMEQEIALSKAKVEDRLVSNKGMVVYNDFEYGPVAQEYVGQILQVRATPTKLYIYTNDRLIASFMMDSSSDTAADNQRMNDSDADDNYGFLS